MARVFDERAYSETFDISLVSNMENKRLAAVVSNPVEGVDRSEPAVSLPAARPR
jgi:hypothetical protein